MSNTGNIGFTTLQEIYSDTGLPTGNTKLNVLTDPDYIPPTLDLVNCPMDRVDPVINTIQIQIENASTQSFLLTNVEVVASSLTLSDAYAFHPTEGLLPATSIYFPIVAPNQLSNYTDIKFILATASFGSRMTVTISYKKQSSPGYITLTTFFVNVGDNVSQYLLNTQLETSGTNFNRLRIVFS